MSNDKVLMNQILEQFTTDVIDWAESQIQRDSTNIPPQFTANADFPIVDKNDLLVKPSDFSSQAPPNQHSTIATKGGLVNAATLADLFMVYGRNLTSIKRCTLAIQQPQTNFTSGSHTTPNNQHTLVSLPAIWSNQRTALSAEYAMDAETFKTQVEAGTNPFDNLQIGNPAAISALTNLIAKIKAVIQNQMNTSAGTISVQVCHSSCHSNCHGSRGRR